MLSKSKTWERLLFLCDSLHIDSYQINNRFKILIFSFNNYYGKFTYHELHIAHLLNIKSHLHFLNLAYSNKKKMLQPSIKTFWYRRDMEKMSICIKTIKNYLSIAVTVCQLVKVKQGLVDTFLQLEGYLHGVKSCSPLITVRFLQTNSMFHYIQSFIKKWKRNI